MNWFQVENDIQAKFDESKAGARRSNELRQLDDLRVAKSEHPMKAAGRLWTSLSNSLTHLFRRKTTPRPARGGSAQPRVARVFRKK